MSTRAISSQRNKRTNVSSTPPAQQIPRAPTSSSTTPPGVSTGRRELSVQEAFSLVNNRISNIEKAVFDGDFSRSSATSVPPRKGELEDLYKQINDIKTTMNNTQSNPYTSINTVTSFDTINAELLMMKNDIMSTRSATQRIDQLNNDINSIKETLTNVSSNTSTDHHDKITSIETSVSELKDIIIKLQNFTLEINDSCIKNMRPTSFDPFDMFRAGINRYAEDDNDDDNDDDEDEHHNGGIVIDHNTEEQPIVVEDVIRDEVSNQNVTGIEMTISEFNTDSGDEIEPEPDMDPFINTYMEPMEPMEETADTVEETVEETVETSDTVEETVETVEPMDTVETVEETVEETETIA